MIKELVKNHIFGRRRYQRLWERIYRWSLAGMHIGSMEKAIDAGEIWVLNYIKESGHRDPSGRLVVFDVGANAGHYSREVLRRFGDSARILCFEPQMEPHAALRNALGSRENVECFNFGFGEREESRTLYTYSGQSGLSSVYDRFVLRGNVPGNGSPHMSEEQITINTLDWFCQTKNIDHITLLKLDVEGHELKVLEGAGRLIEQSKIDFIQFEFGGTHIDSRTFMHDFHEFLKNNFEIYRILKDGLWPISSVQSPNEIFLYSNYLAVSRKLKTGCENGRPDIPSQILDPRVSWHQEPGKTRTLS